MPEVRRQFRMDLPDKVLKLSNAFRAAGYELYVVGGAVRDAIRGSAPKDIDLSTNATPKQVQEVLMSLLDWDADLVGEAFGVVRARHLRGLMEQIKELHEYEIATFREDISMGRHPEVRFTTIKEDVQRRDFTINALFYDIEKGEVVDLVGGLQDLEFGIVRTVGRPEDRFAEDRLRIMRCFRFAARFGYAICVNTQAAIEADNSLDGISPERIRDEFMRAVATAKSVPHLVQLLSHFKMWPQVLPELQVQPAFDTSVSSRGIASRNPIILLSILLEGENKVKVARVLNQLRYSDIDVRQVSFLMNFREMTSEEAPGMRKAFRNSKLTLDELNEYFIERGEPSRDLMNAFKAYLDAPPVSGDVLLAEGYSGRELGTELYRREFQLFEGLLC